ncbi:uncharacterized protein LOC144578134 [Callithrix jacchus]
MLAGILTRNVKPSRRSPQPQHQQPAIRNQPKQCHTRTQSPSRASLPQSSPLWPLAAPRYFGSCSFLIHCILARIKDVWVTKTTIPRKPRGSIRAVWRECPRRPRLLRLKEGASPQLGVWRIVGTWMAVQVTVKQDH